MPNKVSIGPLCGNQPPREAVCIHTKKVYDSCRDKECLQDLRVYLTSCSQAILDASIQVKARFAELLWTYIDVEPIPFNKGFYTVDVKYYYKIVADAFTGMGRPKEICGLATYDKRTVLFGSEGGVRVFSSQYQPRERDVQNYVKTNLPIAVVEVVDPVLLGVKIIEDTDGCTGSRERTCCEIPETIHTCFDDELIVSDESKQLFATLGQFSIIRLERDIQLLMPAYDICMPTKDSEGSADDPCELFQRFKFPVDEFFPPAASDMIRATPPIPACPPNSNCCNRR